MKIRKHLVAAALAVGMTSLATAAAPSGPDGRATPTANAGYYVAKIDFKDHPLAHAVFQNLGSAAGGYAGMVIGAKFGAILGGPIGAVVGAGLGAV